MESQDPQNFRQKEENLIKLIEETIKNAKIELSLKKPMISLLNTRKN
jgi:hypothetical protein